MDYIAIEMRVYTHAKKNQNINFRRVAVDKAPPSLSRIRCNGDIYYFNFPDHGSIPDVYTEVGVLRINISTVLEVDSQACCLMPNRIYGWITNYSIQLNAMNYLSVRLMIRKSVGCGYRRACPMSWELQSECRRGKLPSVKYA